MIAGHCNCGAVSFELTNRPAGVYLCHCSICRRASGSNGMAVVVVPNEHFRWVTGQDQIAAWTKPGSSWETWFCRNCGSRVPGRNDDVRMFVPAGLLGTEADGLTVLHHIFVGSKAGWDVISDDGQQHTERITP